MDELRKASQLKEKMGDVEKMNLNKLFQMQKELENVICESKGLKETPYKDDLLGFMVELSECANEWQGFKYWKENNDPVILKQRKPAMMPDDQEWFNPMLEEYADALHSLLSLGLHLKIKPHEISTPVDVDAWKCDSITDQFIELKGNVYNLFLYKDRTTYFSIFRMFVALGEMLGFAWFQVEDAYMQKNAINHTRQVVRY